jgi:hypothetical protein
MPNVTLHLLLAERVLGHGPRSRLRERFPLEEPACRHAFLQGAFGPDLGYFPGGHRLFSDLAHCVGSGTLTRILLARARTPLERAFAWGWVTHVVADRRLHPVVGRGLAEVHGHAPGGPAFVSADADPAGHVRVETGIDAWISHLHPGLRQRRFQPVFDAHSIRFLEDAYAEAYGIGADPGRLLASHRATAEMSSKALMAVGLLAGGSERPATRLGEATVALAGFATRALGRGDMALAFFSPLPPPAWLRVGVAEEVADFLGHVEAVLDDPEAGLPDVNLDTGRPDGADADHATTTHTLRILEALRGGQPWHATLAARA